MDKHLNWVKLTLSEAGLFVQCEAGYKLTNMKRIEYGSKISQIKSTRVGVLEFHACINLVSWSIQ